MDLGTPYVHEGLHESPNWDPCPVVCICMYTCTCSIVVLGPFGQSVNQSSMCNIMSMCKLGQLLRYVLFTRGSCILFVLVAKGSVLPGLGTALLQNSSYLRIALVDRVGLLWLCLPVMEVEGSWQAYGAEGATMPCAPVCAQKAF